MSRKRRGRGEGSISQRPDGLWVARLSLGYDGAGKRIRKVVYGATKQEAQQKLRECFAGEPTGQAATVATFLHQWLAVIKPTVQPGTYGPYERHVEKHIIPRIGGVKLATLEGVHVQQLYSAMAADGVSPAMQRKIGTTLTIALNKAVELKSIRANPALSIKKPLAHRAEFQVLAPEQVKAFLVEAAKERLYALFLLALDSGARPGELLALTWADVDFAKGQIAITKSLEEISGYLRVKAVKTKRSNRRVDLSEFTLTELNRHRQHMLVEGHASGPVFCNRLGTFVRIGDMHDQFKAALKRAKLPAIRPYDLRHTCATLLLLADENPKIVSERLGHSSVQLTLDTYSHVLPTMQKRAAQKMNAFLA